MTEKRSLRGETAVVLGASSPYGAAAVRALASEGVNLALGGRDREKLEALEAEIATAGVEAIVVGTHLAKRHHPAHLVEAAVEHFGGLDVLLFMAHTSAPPLASLDLDAWEISVDVNLKGFLYCLAAALPAMRDSGGGTVAVLGIEDPGGVPDPLLRASRAAVSVVLEEISLGAFGKIRVAEIQAGVGSPEGCAAAVIRALEEPTNPESGYGSYRI